MATQLAIPVTNERPPHIRYFEYLQFAAVAVQPFTWLAFAPKLFVLILLGALPTQAILLGLALAISRKRQNWARWVLLALYAVAFAGLATVVFMPPLTSLLISAPAAILRGVSLGFVFTKQSSAWLHEHSEALKVPGAAGEPHRAIPAFSLRGRLRIVVSPAAAWVLASGIGGALGGWLAWLAFPSARFAMNLIGHFSWDLVGFASTVGLVFGIAQAAALALLRPTGSEKRTMSMALLWIPATAAGVFAMIFPLWWTYAEALLLAPGYLVAVMLPGVVLMALLQWAIIYFYSPIVGWRWRTIVGAAIGVSVGLIAAMMIGALLPIPMEAVWAGAFGFILGAMQHKPIQEMSSRSPTPVAVH